MKFELNFSQQSVVPAASAPEAAGYYAVKDGEKFFLTFGASAYSWRRIFPRQSIVSEGTSLFPTLQVALLAAYETGYEVFGFENENEVLL